MNGLTVETLPPSSQSASRARTLVRAVLHESGRDDVLDEAMLLVTELVTNSVIHAGTQLELRIELHETRVRVEVVDHSPGSLPLITRTPTELREGGRGIFLLDALATEWGTRHFSSGKSVWFALDLPANADAAPTAMAAAPAGLPLAPHLSAAPRDISWLVGLPAELEQQINSTQLITELLQRLTEAFGLSTAWLMAEDADDDRAWQVLVAQDPTAAEPDIEQVRRIARKNRDAFDPQGALVLPLRARSQVFGALVLIGATDLTPDEVALARLVGDRLSVVIRDDRSHAHQLRSRGSLALLAEASEMFAGTLDVQLALTLAAQLVVPRFAAWSTVLTSYEHAPRLVAVAHGDERRLEDLQKAMSGPEGLALAVRLIGELVDQRPQLLSGDELPELMGEDRRGDVLAVPLVARHRLLGLLLVGRSSGSYGSDDVGLLTDLARRAALAVDNARLYEERTAIAQALQASLLPSTLPVAIGVEFGARYAAAGEGNEVGGDFYDVFGMADGGWGMTIGDVCGKGAEAAAITGMARNVLRLLTQDGFSPPAALRRLNDVILELGERGRFCTTTLGTVHGRHDDVVVRLSSAGHPPPVLLRRDGSAEFIGRSGTVLGVVESVDVEDDTVVLTPGDALVFYTDGVTERRSGSQMYGDDRLLACLQKAKGHSADALAGSVEADVRAFGAGPTRDDLAVLVVRCHVPRPRDSRAPASGTTSEVPLP